MKVYSSKEIRNVAVLGHTGSGKTTILENALYIAGHTTRIGKIEEGNTVSDYDPEEVRRNISISASILPMEWKDTKINFIDTPGFFDFDGEVRQALHVADLAIIVINAKSGIEVGTEKAWDYVTEMNMPRIIFINGMDDPNADFKKVIDDLKEAFGKSIAPVQEPVKEGDEFVGYVNIIKRAGRKYVDGRTQECEVPAHMTEEVEELRKLLEEAVAETDDALMEKFFDDQEFTIEEIQKAKNIGTVDGTVTPVLVGSAANSIGIRGILNSVIEYVPSAAELCPSIKTVEGEEIICSEDGKPVAFVFKTIADPYVGRLSIFRVYSGVIKKDTPLYNANTSQSEKIGQMYIMRGKEQITVGELHAGDIGAISKLNSTSTGDTLCTKDNQVILPPINFPMPLYSMGIVPKGKGDEDKISQAIAKFLEEDKTLGFQVSRETKQSVISGLGDSHLDVLIHKLRTKYKLDVEFTPLIVPYRETIKGKAMDIRGRHKKQSGGAGQFGDVVMNFEPSGDLTTPYVFEEKIFGGAVPRNFFPAVEKGIQESVLAGPLAGYPVVGLKATLHDGSYHTVDSNEISFKLATIIAFKDGFMKAKPILLEPIARIDVYVPDSYTGDIMGDINKRRGRILGMNKEGNKQQISALVPMVEITAYAIDLRSITQGRGYYTMEFEQYEEAPPESAQKVIEAAKG